MFLNILSYAYKNTKREIPLYTTSKAWTQDQTSRSR